MLHMLPSKLLSSNFSPQFALEVKSYWVRSLIFQILVDEGNCYSTSLTLIQDSTLSRLYKICSMRPLFMCKERGKLVESMKSLLIQSYLKPLSINLYCSFLAWIVSFLCIHENQILQSQQQRMPQINPWCLQFNIYLFMASSK